jgi:hypothetical protein
MDRRNIIGGSLFFLIGSRFRCTIEIVAGVAKSACADWDFLTREGGFCIMSGGFNR